MLVTRDDTQHKSDTELVSAIGREPEVFGVLMQRYESRLLRFIMQKSTLTREGAEDVLQESFLKAYQNINSFDDTLSFSSWIYRIVHNTTVSQWRKDKIRPQGKIIHVDADFLARVMSDVDLVRDVDRSFLAAYVGDILMMMDEHYREILVLKFLEEREYKEMSDILKKPMGTIATLVHRAKKQFRERCDGIMQSL